MTSLSKQHKIDELMEKASHALARMSYFEAERFAVKALNMAWQQREYERMARIVLPLQEARRQRYQQALDIGTIRFMDDETISEEMQVDEGCYMVRPPKVGADGRRLRLAGLHREIPVAVVCHEPVTQLGLIPIVSTIPGKSYRVKVRPPADRDNPDMAWFASAIEELGDAALQIIDPARPAERRIETLMEMLDAIPEHEKIHQVLADTCRELMHENAEDASSGAKV
ncbi:MAG: hypothetical protein O7G85_01095 [Planctomycetota bacterium]|nr:hypothetical protein [Planctomycetota bacterium]